MHRSGSTAWYMYTTLYFLIPKLPASSYTAWFVHDLVQNEEDRFSSDVAQSLEQANNPKICPCDCCVYLDQISTAIVCLIVLKKT